MAAEIMGSVGVRQAAMTMDEMKLRLGNTTKIIASRRHEDIRPTSLAAEGKGRTCNDKPPERHSGNNHDQEAFRMICKI